MSSCVASSTLQLEVENLVHEQIDKLVKPLQLQLRGEVRKREEAEEKLRELSGIQDRSVDAMSMSNADCSRSRSSW